MTAARFGGIRREGPGMSGSESEAFLMRLQGAVREMESRSLVGSIVVSDGFADRVMAAIAVEPMPRGTFLAGASGLLHDVLAPIAAIAEAWRVSMTRGRPLLIRAQAFALVLAVAFAVGSAGALAAIGAGRWLAAERQDDPAVIPGPTPPTTQGILPATVSPSPPPESVATDAPTPSPAASASGQPGTTTGAAPAPRATAPNVRPAPPPRERPDRSERDDSSRETDQPDVPDDHSGDGSATSPDGSAPDPAPADPTESDAGG
jgi:hypothetical protein